MIGASISVGITIRSNNGNLEFSDRGNWTDIKFLGVSGYDYIMFKENDNVIGFNCSSNQVLVNSTNASLVLNTLCDEIKNLNRNGGSIKVVEGTYNITAPIEVTHNNTWIDGSGMYQGGTRFYVADNSNCDVFKLVPDTASCYFITLSNFMIHGNKGQQNAGDGITIDDNGSYQMNDVHLWNLFILEMDDIGIDVNYGWGNHFNNILVESCDEEGIESQGDQAYYTDMFIAYNGKSGIYLHGGGKHLNNIQCYHNDYHGLWVGSDDNVICNIISEGNNQGAAGQNEIHVQADDNLLTNIRAWYDGSGTITSYGFYIRGDRNLLTNLWTKDSQRGLYFHADCNDCAVTNAYCHGTLQNYVDSGTNTTNASMIFG